MSTRFFTNLGEQTLFRKFQGVCRSNPDIERFDALVGYLRSSGYFALRPYLEEVPHIRILVGINVDAIMADYHRRGLLFLADSKKALHEFRDSLRKDIQGAAYRHDVEMGVLQFVDDVVSRKIQLRAHPTKRLHAKLYIFRPKGFNEHKPGAVITGSSNLTGAGIGVDENSRNYEFNVLLHDFDDVAYATDEFERLWKESVEILPKYLQEVRDTTYLAATVSPYELYFKLLLEYFGQSVEYDPNAITDMPQGFKRLSYQIDAVTSGFRLLEKHGGFFLADVVGLGKTIIATLIAKKFFFHNGFPEHRSHTLIVVPPALEDSWRETTEAFRLDNCDLITNGSLHKVKRPGKYDLVIVDEAHKFRNDTAEAFDELQRICKSPTQRLLPDGTRASKKVILVSATPLNNRPEDIRNLISLFQDLKDSTLSVANLQRFFAQREKDYRQAHTHPDVEQARKQVKAIYELIRTKVISEVIVRRTRSDLVEHDDYRLDLEQQGVIFPEIKPPRKILYQLSPALEDLYDRTVRLLSQTDGSGLTYNRYRAIGFLKPDKKRKYANADRISAQLAFIMRTLLIKRLDSSFYAFKRSLARFRDATSVMRDMFARGTVYIAPNLNVTEFLMEGREEELIAKIAERQPTDPTIEICTPADFEVGFIEGLEQDWQKLDDFCRDWDKVEEDPKLDEFLRCLKTELQDRQVNHEGKKLVVFSESKETTGYLLGRLAQAGYRRVLTVSSDNRAERMPVVRANFDANTDDKANDYDILISTEVLAEGVNLHRANVIVNYDTPWNSTRLMQRIGRVNRIGCVAPHIYIYNFYPTTCVDDDIELRKKAIMKLQAFHTALGEDSQIYSETEEVDTFGLFDHSPEEKERDERLALLMELRQFRQQHPEQFRRIKGLPLRARVGRVDSGRAGSTVAFIRSQRRDGFYRISNSSRREEPHTPNSPLSTPQSALEEITLLEAAREFRAPDPAEKAIPLHTAHHDHVNAALDSFKESVTNDTLQTQTVDTAQGPNERRALQYLDGFVNLPFINEDERLLIRAAQTAIRRARFQNLQRQINQLYRSTKTVKMRPGALADKLMQILRTYPLDALSAEKPGSEVQLCPLDTTPEIIISESFDQPQP
ncbi:MAG TPA: helicase-related protein [Candidatus Paceibacterota bacterium]|nr:helicase-related protein [Verrucomicrobiota bacterium]HRY49125.1 helicase-related protein [Candidatus Paceibacterota bacterium]HSA02061.1 helicase-related protein [Candidatus Paceibacterota bacterium]